MADFASLGTLDDVRQFVAEAYRASQSASSKWARLAPPLRFGFEYGKLPLVVAEPGPLIEHAVRLAGAEGLTLQELRGLFERLGAERLDRGLRFARAAGLLVESQELRPNKARRPQRQVVFRVATEGGE
jgi:hypothetical protein